MARSDTPPQINPVPGAAGVPRSRPVPKAQPGPPLRAVPPGQPLPQGRPVNPQGQAIPQGRAIPPQGLTYPAGQPIPPGQPIPQGQAYPAGQPIPPGQPIPQGQAYPVGQALPQGATRPAVQGALAGQPYAQTPQSGRPQPVPAGGRPVPVQGGQRTTAVRARDEEEEEPEDLTEVAVRNAPPWLISAVFHMLLLVILGLWFLPQLTRNQISLQAIDDEWAEKLGEQLEFDSPLGLDNLDKIEEPVLTPDNLPEVDDPFAAPTQLDIVSPDGYTATFDQPVDQIGLALNGRQVGMKKSLLGAYGGTKLTEAAVQAGLEWLARQQRKDGSWSLLGPYGGGASTNQDNPEAATGLALLAFQGNGNTDREGRFKKNVEAGWKWLLKQQDGNGNFFHEGAHPHPFYTQGICTIGICELYAMTKDERYKDPAQRAVAYCLASQSPEGGWRYQPQMDSDVSVTGWIVMALQSARMAGLEVPADHFRRVERFLDRVSPDGGTRYCYQKGKEPTLTMTAEAMLCRQYLGWPRNDPRLNEACDWITRDGNRIDFDAEKRQFGPKRNTYYWYYATQVCHHMEGDYWKRWNEVMRAAVPKAQETRGREAGSWAPDLNDPFEAHGGRLYSTCLCIYMLEVYYRHLPIYSKIYDLMGKPRSIP